MTVSKYERRHHKQPDKMSTTSWQVGANYHDSNPFLRNTSNSSYGNWFGGGPPGPQPPPGPSYGSLGPRGGRRLGGLAGPSDNRFSTVTSRDVQDIISSNTDTHPIDKFYNFMSKHGSGKVTPISDYDRIMAREYEAHSPKRPMVAPVNTPDLSDEIGLNELKLSPRIPSNGLSPLMTSPRREPPIKYDIRNDQSSLNLNGHDPPRLGLTRNNTFDTSISQNRKANLATLDRANTYHNGFTPSPPLHHADSANPVPSWRARYQTPSTSTNGLPGKYSEPPISTASKTERPIINYTSSASINSPNIDGSAGPHGSSTSYSSSTSYGADKPAYSSKLTTPSGLIPSSTYHESSALHKASDYGNELWKNRDESDPSEANQRAIAQTKPMYWLYGSRGRPSTPVQPSSYAFKTEHSPQPPNIYNSPSRMNDLRDGLTEIPRAEYTRDLGGALPRQNSFSTMAEPLPTEYASRLTEYTPHQYSQTTDAFTLSQGDYKYDTNINHPPPPGSPAKKSILKKTSSYSSFHGFGGGETGMLTGVDADIFSRLPPLSSAGSTGSRSGKRVTFNHEQKFHPI